MTKSFKIAKNLVVEDNEQNYKLLKQMLKPFGRADIAANGITAIKAFIRAHEKQEPYDIIFLDIMMPGLNGHDVLKQIRDWEKQNKPEETPVKVVMATALDDTDTIIKSYDVGAQHYLKKPYNKLELESLMNEIGFTKFQKNP